MRKKIVILYSGGLDSFIMKRLSEVENKDDDVVCVYYAHGAESEKEEVSLLPLNVIRMNVDWLGKNGIGCVAKKSEPLKGSIYIPGRNLVFVTLAACQFLPDEIWLGSLVDEVNIDATDKNAFFRDVVSGLTTYTLSPFKEEQVRVVFPLADRGWTKVDAVRWALNHGVSIYDISKKSSSCWHSHNGVPCGECWQCLKRFVTFREATGSYLDFEEYAVHPLKSKKVAEMIADLLQKKNPNTDDLNMQNLVTKNITPVEISEMPTV